MRLQLSKEEKQVFAQLANAAEGAVLVGYLRRLQNHLTNTRNIDQHNLTPDQVAALVAGANQASDILEENVIQLLGEKPEHRAEPDRLD